MNRSHVRSAPSSRPVLSASRIRRAISAAAFGACFGLMVRPAPAVEFTWNPGGANGGSGTWNTTTTNWNSGTAAWPSSGTDNDALFAGTAGTVTIQAGGVTANDVRFSTTGYQVTGGPLRLNGASSGTATVTVDTNVSATVNSLIDLSASTTVAFQKAGPGTLEITNGLTLKEGTAANENRVVDGTLLLTSGTLVVTAPLVNNTTLRMDGGGLRQTGGSITVGVSGTGSSGRFLVGSSTTYGYYGISSGTLSMPSGNTSARNSLNNGVMEITGGAVTVSDIFPDGKRFPVAAQAGGATLYATGGSMELSGTFASQLIVGETVSGGARNGQVTLAGTATISTTRNVVLAGLVNSGTAATIGILNLNGDSVLTTAGIVDGGGANASGGRHLSFDGGTLRAAAGFTLSGLTSAQLNGGGAKFDTNGFDLTISQALLAPATGLTSVAMATSGSGYIGAPAVTVTGGGGTGASAVANWDPATGQVTGITITNPGRGYTSSPTVALFGGTSSVGTAATLGAVTTGAVTGGGLTKLGAGTLTLSASNTYTGATTVSAGTLALGAGGSFAASPLITVADGAFLNVAAVTGGFSLASTQTLGGRGTLVGAATFASGARLAFDATGPLIAANTLSFTNFGIGSLAGVNWDSLDLNSPYTLINGVQDFASAGLFNFGDLNKVAVGNGNREAYFASSGTTLQLVVVPEPGSLALAGLGVAVAAWAARRRGERPLAS